VVVVDTVDVLLEVIGKGDLDVEAKFLVGPMAWELCVVAVAVPAVGG
jgi:hypothetical protein